MKKVIATALMAFFIGTFASCKDKNDDATEMETEMNADGTTEMEMETDTNTTVNDTNVSGTTSGEMEQVP